MRDRHLFTLVEVVMTAVAQSDRGTVKCLSSESFKTPYSCQKNLPPPSLLQFSEFYRFLLSIKLIKNDQKTVCNAQATHQGFINFTAILIY